MSKIERTPSVLFICVKNGGKSQMAAGLMGKIAGDAVQVHSAGTKPGETINASPHRRSPKSAFEISKETPKLVDPQLVCDVDIVVTLGREAHVDLVPGMHSRAGTLTNNPNEETVGIIVLSRLGPMMTDLTMR